MAKDVIVSGRDADGMSRADQKRAREAMDNAVVGELTGTDIPRTETNEETLKQQEGERKLAAKQAAFVQKQQEQIAKNAPTGEAPAIPVEDPADMDWKPVKLTVGYVPKKMYRVMEGESPRVHAATLGRVLDKVQSGSKIELPADEARQVVSNKLGERADEF